MGKKGQSYYIVFTSNIGAGEAMRMESSAFAIIECSVLRRVDQVLRPELVARINEKLVFNRLPFTIQRKICELMISREVEGLNRLGHSLIVEPTTVEILVREGFHRTLGCQAHAKHGRPPVSASHRDGRKRSLHMIEELRIKVALAA